MFISVCCYNIQGLFKKDKLFVQMLQFLMELLCIILLTPKVDYVKIVLESFPIFLKRFE